MHTAISRRMLLHSALATVVFSCSNSEPLPPEAPKGSSADTAALADSASAADTGVLLAAGDIAGCPKSDGAESTARLLDRLGGTVLTLGDNAYPNGTIQSYETCYAPTWGRHRARTRPVPGNHEYDSPDAAPYFAYFDTLAGPAGKGYYSFEVGGWHVIALNSNIDTDESSPQVQWLRTDLAAHPASCTLAYFHHARFSSGPHGDHPRMQPIWQALYDAGADVVLNGHDHLYERFAPQTPDGKADSVRGIREIVAGTGGRSHYAFQTPRPNSEFRDDDDFGVLRLELAATDYHWSFLTTNGAVPDSGSGQCH